MIRRHVGSEPAFYFSDEIGRGPMADFYDAVDDVIGDWDQVSLPLAGAFNRGFGRPTDVVLYLKMFLIAYFQNVVFDTRLAALCSDSISIRRFLGLTLVDRVPDHSSISRVRDAFAEHGGLHEVLSYVVGLCEEAGLVSGSSVHVDTTLIKANAALDSMCALDTGISVRQHLNEAREQGRKASVKNSEFYSPRDPESRVRKKGDDKTMLCYMGVHVTDSKNQVILAARMDYGDSAEVAATLPAVMEAQETLCVLGKSMDVVSADKGFDSSTFHSELENAGLRPATFYQREKKQEGRFSRSDFTFDAERNLYVCPWGKELGYRGYKEKSFAYVSLVSDCKGCPFRDCCLGQKAERKELSRTPNEDSSDRNRAFVATKEGKAHLRKRSSTVEPPFGHAKSYGGLIRINCLGLAKADAKFVTGAVAWNIQKLIKARKAGIGASPPKPKKPLLEGTERIETPQPAPNITQTAFETVKKHKTAIHMTLNAFKSLLLSVFIGFRPRAQT